MNAFLTRRFRFAAAALALTGTLAACDNPVEEEEEEHAVGVVVLNAQNVEVARINVEATPAVTGSITIPSSGTQSYTVRGLLEDGDIVSLVGGELELRASVANPQLATAQVSGNQTLALTGLQAGATTVTLSLFHGDHADVERAVPLIVQ